MTRGYRVLFFTRLFLYLLVFTLPVVHPAIAVSYDIPSSVLWFFLVPWEMTAAFFFAPPRTRPRTWAIIAALPAAVAAFLVTGLNPAAFPFLGAAAAAFSLTVLIFRFPKRGRIVALGEQIFLAAVIFRMLGFSRASEDLAAESSALTQTILVLTPAVFLLHGIVLYMAAYRRPRPSPASGSEEAGRGGGRGRREFALFAFIIIAVVLTLVVLLPPDFVKNSVVANLLQDEVRPQPVPMDIYGDGYPGGNLRSDRDGQNGSRGRFPWDRGDGQGRNRLEGIPSDQWPGTGQGQGQGGESKQYAVMVIAGKKDPIYAGSAYRGRFDPVRGFLLSEGDILNDLPRLRLLETWRDGAVLPDRMRSLEDIYVISTLPERYLPYNPHSIEPTVLHREYSPFRFSYHAQSLMTDTGPAEWRRVRDLTAQEEDAFRPYLDVPLARNDLAIFDAHLRGALEGKTGYFEKIAAILRSFSTFQYNIGYDEDTSISAMVDFLTFTKEGDCTEFSNTSAVLARLAGIPARVVTGFLASGELQTPSHIRGLAILRGAIKPLQSYPLEELFLVTTAHRHSWVQFWLPEYGWIDFETTSFAIPPAGFGDPNNRDVVIPLLQEDPSLVPIPSFPWRTLLRWAGILLAGGVLLAYLFRYGREAYLVFQARRSDDAGVRALYRLLLIKIAAEGRPLKPPAKTSREYSEYFPEEPAFLEFAALYTRLRYRENTPEEREALFAELRREFHAVTGGLKRPGPVGALRRVFSLRSLSYIW
jgi:transglutaminase-like putative cysteine protease